MRISDWSSDVCSSDLQATLVVPGVDLGDPQHAGAREARPADPSRLPAAAAILGAGPQHPHARAQLLGAVGTEQLDHLGAVADLDALDGRGRGDLDAQLDRVVAGLHDVAHHDLVDRARSEEHTSELQSLMRISYAVFCLKKKKKTRQY